MNIIVISYTSRSGSTYLSNQLGKFDHVWSLPEWSFVHKLIQLGDTRLQKMTVQSLTDLCLTDRHFGNLKITHLQLTEILQENKSRGVRDLLMALFEQHFGVEFKNSDTIVLKKGAFLYLKKEVLNIFTKDNVTWIYMVRDPRGIINSGLNTMKAYSPKHNFAMGSLKLACLRVKKYFNRISEYRKEKNTIFVRYEDLIRDTAGIVNNVLHMTFQNKQAVYTKSKDNKTIKLSEAEKGIHKLVNKAAADDRIFAWRKELNTSSIEYIERNLTNIMTEFSYPLSSLPRSFSRTLRFDLIQTFKFYKANWLLLIDRMANRNVVSKIKYWIYARTK